MNVANANVSNVDIFLAVTLGSVCAYILYTIYNDTEAKKKQVRACFNIRVRDLYVYPIKACKGERVLRANFTTSGLEHDREWMVYNPKTKIMVSQRDFPCMAWIEPKLSFDTSSKLCNGLHLSAPGMTQLFVANAPETESNLVPSIKIWGHQVAGTDQGDEASEWISKYLNDFRRSLRGKNVSNEFVAKEFRLLRVLQKNRNRAGFTYVPTFLGGEMKVARAPKASNDNINEASERHAAQTSGNDLDASDAKEAVEEKDFQTYKTYSDGFPLLVVSQASLDEVNKRLQAKGEKTISMIRFRPNIVISSVSDGASDGASDGVDELEAFVEDKLGYLTVRRNDVSLYLTKPCTRCSVPTIDPITLEKNVVVTKTLKEFRTGEHLKYEREDWKEAVFFGMNACHDRVGDIQVGDALDTAPLPEGFDKMLCARAIQ